MPEVSILFIIIKCIFLLLVRYEVEIEIQKQKTNDTLKPLISELNELEEQVCFS
jgi:hypothetical protein